MCDLTVVVAQNSIAHDGGRVGSVSKDKHVCHTSAEVTLVQDESTFAVHHSLRVMKPRTRMAVQIIFITGGCFAR